MLRSDRPAWHRPVRKFLLMTQKHSAALFGFGPPICFYGRDRSGHFGGPLSSGASILQIRLRILSLFGLLSSRSVELLSCCRSCRKFETYVCARPALFRPAGFIFFRVCR